MESSSSESLSTLAMDLRALELAFLTGLALTAGLLKSLADRLRFKSGSSSESEIWSC